MYNVCTYMPTHLPYILYLTVLSVLLVIKSKPQNLQIN